MKWQPMPASAFDPSGTRVEVLCGQPEQKYGVRVAPAHRDHPVVRGQQRGGPFRQLHLGSKRVEPPGDDGQQQGGRQFAGPRHQPFARLVALADHHARLVAGPVVEILFELAFDDAALFLDDEDLFLFPDEIQRVAARQRPHHADLVDVDAKLAALGLAKTEQAQRLHQVEMALAGGNDAEAGILDVVDAAVDRVGLGKGEDGVLLRFHPLLDLRTRQIRPAVVQPARRRHVIGLGKLAR
jgi:hypothetical protein